MIPVLLAPRPAPSNDPQSAPLLPADQGEASSDFDAALEAEAEGPPGDGVYPAWLQPKEGGALRQIGLAVPSGEIATGDAAAATDADVPQMVAGLMPSPDQAITATGEAGETTKAKPPAPEATLPQDGTVSAAGMPDPVTVMALAARVETGAQPTTPLGLAGLPEPIPETALGPLRATSADRPTERQSLPIPGADRAAPLPQDHDFSGPERLAMPEDLSLEPPARSLQSSAVEGAIRFALAVSETPEARLPLPPPTAPLDVTPTDPRRKLGGQAPLPKDETFSVEEASAKTPRPAAATAAPRTALPAPIPQDPALLPAAADDAPQDLAAIGDAELLSGLSDTPRNHARSPSMQSSPASLPTSLPSTILGVVLAPVPGGVEVALSPAELGQLRIEVTPDGDTLRILLSAERPETLDLLRRHADQLMVEVLQEGFSGAAMSFGTWGGQTGGEGASTQPALPMDGDARPDVAAAFAHLPHLPAHDGGLNLRL